MTTHKASETSPLLTAQVPCPIRDDERALPATDGNDHEHREDQDHSSSDDNCDGDNDEEYVRVHMSNTRLAVILLSANIGYLMAAIDHTILATLTGPITSSISSLAMMPYLAVAYTLSLTPCVAVNGRLGDIFGRGRMLTGAMVLMAVGSLLVGLSPAKSADLADQDASSFWGVFVFLLGRVLTGMGAGPALVQPMLLAGDLLPQRSRGLAQGITSMTWGFGCVMGGFLGGFINDTIGWRWAFLLQVPICLAVGCVSATCINVPPKVSKSGRGYLARIDFTGAALLVATLLSFQVPLNAGGTLVPWSHPAIPVLFVAAVACLVSFIRVELKARQPILPVRVLVSNRNVPLACCFGLLSVTLYIYGLYYIPLFFQVVGGETSTQAGLRLLVVSIGDMASGFCGGWVTKATGRYVPVGLVCLTLGMAGYGLLATLDETTAAQTGALSFSVANLGILLVGGSVGSMGLVATLSSISSVSHEMHAVVVTAVQVFRESGATVGIATSGALLQNLLRTELWRRFGDMPDAGRHIERILSSVLRGDFPDGWGRDEIMKAFVEAFRGIWIAGVVAAAVALVGVASLKQNRLRERL